MDEGEAGGVELHSFHRGCVSANQVTPSSVPGNWEGRISSMCPYWTLLQSKEGCVHTGNVCVYVFCEKIFFQDLFFEGFLFL